VLEVTGSGPQIDALDASGWANNEKARGRALAVKPQAKDERREGSIEEGLDSLQALLCRPSKPDVWTMQVEVEKYAYIGLVGVYYDPVNQTQQLLPDRVTDAAVGIDSVRSRLQPQKPTQHSWHPHKPGLGRSPIPG
jgi:hypothetical protein